MIHIVLFQPEIAPNTGNISRLCACNDFHLHLIHPLGFSLSESHVKRAGLDYWDSLQLTEHDSWEKFETYAASKSTDSERSHSEMDNLFFFSSHGTKPYWDVQYPLETYLVFGSETRGLPQEIHEKYAQNLLQIPMVGKGARCLNLSNSASIAGYEALRQREIVS
jgi:tRNA (cytidine/uridine-2'-O-)-methyltransferase